MCFEFSVVNIKSGGFGGEEAVPPGMCKALFGTGLPQMVFIIRARGGLGDKEPLCSRVELVRKLQEGREG